MYENIEVLVVDFVYMLLDILDNPNNYNDILDFVVVYEKKVMMNNKDYLLLLIEHLINLNLVMKLLDQQVMMHVLMVGLIYVVFVVAVVVVDDKMEVDVVGIEDHALLKLIGLLY
jgi:hypothetical protein